MYCLQLREFYSIQLKLSTKQDLQIALRDKEIRLIKWLIGTGIAMMITLGGMISKGFH